MGSIEADQSTSSASVDSGGDVLAELFPQANARGEIIRHLAEGRYLVEHGAPKSLEERVAERFPTPEKLAEYAPDMLVSVYGFKNRTSAAGMAAGNDDIKELRTFQPRSASEAVPLYHAGHTIICWRLLEDLPEALQRGGDILAAIGMPRHPMAARGLREPWSSKRLFVVSLVYTNGAGKSGLGMHFDKFDSVVVQLRGQKRWRVGRTPHLEFPVYNEDDAKRLDFPPSLPRHALRMDEISDPQTIEMRRGSALLLPRGTFHTTLADGESSFSLGYHLMLPTWSDVVLGALERRLSQDPFMRGTPFGAFLPEGPSADARAGMQQAAGRAREALRDPAALLERDLLGNLASPHQAVYRLSAAARSRMLLGDQPIISGCGSGRRDVPLPPEAAALCGWLVSQCQGWFVFNEAVAAAGGAMSPRAVWSLLQESVEEGLVERRWGTRQSA
jgi:Cupin superfamily protein